MIFFSVCSSNICCFFVQEVFHVYLNKFEIAVSHLFLIIFSNDKGVLSSVPKHGFSSNFAYLYLITYEL